jgi:hypothetical protein
MLKLSRCSHFVIATIAALPSITPTPLSQFQIGLIREDQCLSVALDFAFLIQSSRENPYLSVTKKFLPSCLAD